MTASWGRERPAVSLHPRILAEVEARILSGEWPPGHRIPFEHELTARYGCSRMTVSKALTQLAGAGLIERRRKAGSFVTRPHAIGGAGNPRRRARKSRRSGCPIATGCCRGGGGGRARRPARLGVAAGAAVLALICRHDAARGRSAWRTG